MAIRALVAWGRDGAPACHAGLLRGFPQAPGQPSWALRQAAHRAYMIISRGMRLCEVGSTARARPSSV